MVNQKQQDRSPGRRYWRANLYTVGALLAVWFAVSFLCGIVFIEPLNTLHIGGAPLGFWFAQQGSIYVFVVLILIYVVVMNRLDARFGFRED
jgi:putative solute:sodium symporter small subunit